MSKAPEMTIEEKDKLVQETLEKNEKYLNPSLARIFKFMGLNTMEWTASGSVVTDIYGREFLDCAGGYGMFVQGHSHPKIIAAVKEQLDRMPLSSKVLLSKPSADLAEKLAEITPEGLQYSFFCNSGAEAVEGALKMARMATGKTKIVATVGAFHGKTMGALSASGRELYKKPFEPLVPGFVHVPFDDIEAMREAVDDETAAVIVEPVQGEGGVMFPSDDYLPAVRAICDEHNALLILDEVQSGFGRTGKFFACQHYDVAPDIMTLAKALGGGVIPMGAFIANPRVWEQFIVNPLIHTTTFGANPIGCTAGLAGIHVIEEENLIEKAATVGEQFIKDLQAIAQKYPECIAEVRGKGFLIGVEMTTAGVGGMMMSELIDRDILAVYTLNKPKVLRMEPPLATTKEQLDRVLVAIEAAAGKCAAIIDQLQD